MTKYLFQRIDLKDFPARGSQYPIGHQFVLMVETMIPKNIDTIAIILPPYMTRLQITWCYCLRT
jgi:hypothetical protein